MNKERITLLVNELNGTPSTPFDLQVFHENFLPTARVIYPPEVLQQVKGMAEWLEVDEDIVRLIFTNVSILGQDIADGDPGVVSLVLCSRDALYAYTPELWNIQAAGYLLILRDVGKRQLQGSLRDLVYKAFHRGNDAGTWRRKWTHLKMDCKNIGFIHDRKIKHDEILRTEEIS